MEPLVSVIIPTKNSGKLLELCLKSLRQQTYKQIEIIVVDNRSTDDTKIISKKFNTHFMSCGPERAAQKNYGAWHAKGEYLFFVDSDMELEPTVVKDCLTKMKKCDALVIPEKSVGEGFWNECIILERSCYVGDLDMEGYRFFKTHIFRKLNGFDETLVASGEDLDISQRARRLGFKVGRVDSFIIHHEGSRTPLSTIKKWRYYGKNMTRYYSKNPKEAALQYLPIRRGWIKNWRKLIMDPVHTLGFILLKICNFIGVMWGQLEAVIYINDEKINPYK